MTHHIHQEIVFKATPARIYEVLTNATQFSHMSGGAPAEIDAKPGGSFSCFGGMIEGRNIECNPGTHLIQAWRAKTWEPSVYSIVRFRLIPEGTFTRLTMDQVGFPEGQAEHLEQGWHTNYWEPIQKLLP